MARVDTRRRAGETFEGHDRNSGKLKWTGTRVDLVFAPTRNYAPGGSLCPGGCQGQVRADFVAVWDKVMKPGPLRLADFSQHVFRNSKRLQ